jgi:hypothetical protein
MLGSVGVVLCVCGLALIVVACCHWSNVQGKRWREEAHRAHWAEDAMRARWAADAERFNARLAEIEDEMCEREMERIIPYTSIEAIPPAERYDYERLVEDIAELLADQPLPPRPRITRQLTAAEVRQRERSFDAEVRRLAVQAALEAQREAIDAALPDLRASSSARQWLIKHLSSAQLADFTRTGSFNVRGGSTGGLYRITYGRSMNIAILNADGMPTGRRLCFSPRGNLSTFDVMLGQKVSLESDELFTLRVACVNIGPPAIGPSPHT